MKHSWLLRINLVSRTYNGRAQIHDFRVQFAQHQMGPVMVRCQFVKNSTHRLKSFQQQRVELLLWADIPEQRAPDATDKNRPNAAANCRRARRHLSNLERLTLQPFE